MGHCACETSFGLQVLIIFIKCDLPDKHDLKIIAVLPFPCLVGRRAHIANLNLGINARDYSRTRAGLAGEKKSIMIF